MADKVRLGVIGCGGIAGSHLRSYAELKERGLDLFEFVAVCDVDEERAKGYAERAAHTQDNRCPNAYTSLLEMLEEERLDAVDICTPHFDHHVSAIDCLNAGLDVLVEKPFAITVKAGRKMLEAAERNGRILATAEQHRRDPTRRMVHWAINQARLIGEPRLWFSLGVGFNLGVVVGTPWRHDKVVAGGGWCLDGGVHYIDFVLHLFGDVETVYAETRTFEPTRYQDDKNLTGPVPVSVEDTSIATLTHQSGVIGVWALSHGAPGKGFRQHVYYGSEGSLDGDGVTKKDGAEIPTQRLHLDFLYGLSGEEKERLFPHGITNAITVELHDFLQAALHRRPPEVDGWAGLKAQAVCAAVYESAQAGQPVRVEEVLSGKAEGYQREINEHWGV